MGWSCVPDLIPRALVGEMVMALSTAVLPLMTPLTCQTWPTPVLCGDMPPPSLPHEISVTMKPSIFKSFLVWIHNTSWWVLLFNVNLMTKKPGTYQRHNPSAARLSCFPRSAAFRLRLSAGWLYRELIKWKQRKEKMSILSMGYFWGIAWNGKK